MQRTHTTPKRMCVKLREIQAFLIPTLHITSHPTIHTAPQEALIQTQYLTQLLTHPFPYQPHIIYSISLHHSSNLCFNLSYKSHSTSFNINHIWPDMNSRVIQKSKNWVYNFVSSVRHCMWSGKSKNTKRIADRWSLLCPLLIGL